MKQFSIHQGIKSGQAEQAVRKYKKIVGKTGVWYVSIQENEGDNIYYSKNNGKYSDGFGGSTLSFELEDGTVDHVQGPWHSNSGGLLLDTGYDATHKHLTRGIVALDLLPVKGDFWKTQHEQVLHFDEEPVIGDYSRIEIMAQDFANKLGKPVYYAVVSTGGGHSGWKNPIKE
jgi:hypothetical protein